MKGEMTAPLQSWVPYSPFQARYLDRREPDGDGVPGESFEGFGKIGFRPGRA